MTEIEGQSTVKTKKSQKKPKDKKGGWCASKKKPAKKKSKKSKNANASQVGTTKVKKGDKSKSPGSPTKVKKGGRSKSPGSPTKVKKGGRSKSPGSSTSKNNDFTPTFTLKNNMRAFLFSTQDPKRSPAASQQRNNPANQTSPVASPQKNSPARNTSPSRGGQQRQGQPSAANVQQAPAASSGNPSRNADVDDNGSDDSIIISIKVHHKGGSSGAPSTTGVQRPASENRISSRSASASDRNVHTIGRVHEIVKTLEPHLFKQGNTLSKAITKRMHTRQYENTDSSMLRTENNNYNDVISTETMIRRRNSLNNTPIRLVKTKKLVETNILIFAATVTVIWIISTALAGISNYARSFKTNSRLSQHFNKREPCLSDDCKPNVAYQHQLNSAERCEPQPPCRDFYSYACKDCAGRQLHDELKSLSKVEAELYQSLQKKNKPVTFDRLVFEQCILERQIKSFTSQKLRHILSTADAFTFPCSDKLDTVNLLCRFWKTWSIDILFSKTNVINDTVVIELRTQRSLSNSKKLKNILRKAVAEALNVTNNSDYQLENIYQVGLVLFNESFQNYQSSETLSLQNLDKNISRIIRCISSKNVTQVKVQSSSYLQVTLPKLLTNKHFNDYALFSLLVRLSPMISGNLTNMRKLNAWLSQEQRLSLVGKTKFDCFRFVLKNAELCLLARLNSIVGDKRLVTIQNLLNSTTEFFRQSIQAVLSSTFGEGQLMLHAKNTITNITLRSELGIVTNNLKRDCINVNGNNSIMEALHSAREIDNKYFELTQTKDNNDILSGAIFTSDTYSKGFEETVLIFQSFVRLFSIADTIYPEMTKNNRSCLSENYWSAARKLSTKSYESEISRMLALINGFQLTYNFLFNNGNIGLTFKNKPTAQLMFVAIVRDLCNTRFSSTDIDLPSSYLLNQALRHVPQFRQSFGCSPRDNMVATKTCQMLKK